MPSGIYQIKHAEQDKCYVGSAVNISARWSKHRRELRKGVHHSAKLQRAWNKYGEASFVFETLITCAISTLIHYEQQFIDQMPSKYNMSPTAGNCLGSKRSDETRAKMSAANVGNKRALGLKRPDEFGEMVRRVHTGKILSAETRARISASKKNPSQETLDKFRASRKGKPVASAAHAEKLRTQNIGRKHTPEAIANMREGSKRREERRRSLCT
ncbi:MAG: hypothetical protein A2Y38_12205 [Spirochaetes bacterium GWB1_59_5]|nr:MAG: hypothetical protein A2Y38_12205 [Spirochaetes bacterium GWB1_59_5]